MVQRGQDSRTPYRPSWDLNDLVGWFQSENTHSAPRRLTKNQNGKAASNGATGFAQAVLGVRSNSHPPQSMKTLKPLLSVVSRPASLVFTLVLLEGENQIGRAHV